MKLEFGADGQHVTVFTKPDYGARVKVPPKQRRCSCHMDPIYDGLSPCPSCRHWSFDARANACERRKCGYEVAL